MIVTDDGTITTNTSPTSPSNITVPSTAFEGDRIAVSWSASSDKESNLAGYTLQRLSNGSWTQIYKGPSRAFTDSRISVGTTSVQYRVQAYDSFNLTSNWTISSTVKIVKKPPTLTTPFIVMTGQPIAISWTAIDGSDSYTLQRKADAGEWEQVYSGADTTFTDTAGSWSTVQYQVCGVFDGTNGAFAVSDVITVAPASTLVISGQDGELGTITADIPYSVATDTGRQIALTQTVNGALVYAQTVDSGFSGSIPVLDLPTGTGTIIITATVQTDRDPVTVTRTWTYTKQAQTFPVSGGVGQLTQDGQNVFPLTLAEAVKAIGGPWGGNLSTALDKLAKAAIYTTTGDFADLWGNIIPTVKIETGSYVGTGTYGSSNPTTITFPSKPTIVFILKESQTGTNYLLTPLIQGSKFALVYRGSTNFYTLGVSWGDNSVILIGDNVQTQQNGSGERYNYVALLL